MIPNSAPMAAVYRTDSGQLFSRPVAAFNESGNALVLYAPVHTRLLRADYEGHPDEFIGIWHHDWAPDHDDMSSLLPPVTRDRPRPKTRVTIAPTLGGWSAWHTTDRARVVASAATRGQLEQKLAVLGDYRVAGIEEDGPSGD